jgi:hypothetical protein
MLQLGMLFQPPILYWPSPHTSQHFAQLTAELTRCAGSNDFAAMDHSGLGGHAFVHTLALSDLRMNRDALGQRATAVVLSALSAPHPDGAPRALAISASFPELMRTLSEHYTLCARSPELHMPTGYAIPETFIYGRK